jgi:hypothetical protein
MKTKNRVDEGVGETKGGAGVASLTNLTIKINIVLSSHVII